MSPLLNSSNSIHIFLSYLFIFSDILLFSLFILYVSFLLHIFPYIYFSRFHISYYLLYLDFLSLSLFIFSLSVSFSHISLSLSLIYLYLFFSSRLASPAPRAPPPRGAAHTCAAQGHRGCWTRSAAWTAPGPMSPSPPRAFRCEFPSPNTSCAGYVYMPTCLHVYIIFHTFHVT